MGYECCSAMYSSYCPECCGQTCMTRKQTDKDKEKLWQEALNKVDNPMLVVNAKECDI